MPCIHYLLLLIASLLFFGCSPKNAGKAAASDENETASKPNIIIILADDLGYGDVGYYGSDIKTPNLDTLAKEGIVLNRYYVAPVCSPTRAGLMTGRYPDRFGLRQTVIPPWRDYGVDTSEVFLPEVLAEAGYKHRAILGKWHLGHSRLQYHPLQRGFTHFYGHFNGAIDYFTHKREGELDWHNDYQSSHDKGYTTDLLTREAIKCIGQYAKESPFFLYVAYNAPHVPLQAKEEDLLLYGFDKNKPLFSDKKGYGEKGRGNTRYQTYAAMVTALDRGVGQILQTLEELGIEDNTLVLFHSDNGPDPGQGGTSGSLRGHKFQEWEGGVRVPAIVRWPNGFQGGRTSDQVMGYVDVMPTLIEIAGFSGKPAKPLDGISMLPVFRGEKQQINRDIYLGSGAIVNHDWKLVKATGENPKMDIKHDMLFNIAEDVAETTNQKQEYPKRYEELNDRVTQFDTIESDNKVPPYQQGQKGFKAPKEWTIDY